MDGNLSGKSIFIPQRDALLLALEERAGKDYIHHQGRGRAVSAAVDQGCKTQADSGNRHSHRLFNYLMASPGRGGRISHHRKG